MHTPLSGQKKLMHTRVSAGIIDHACPKKSQAGPELARDEGQHLSNARTLI